MIGPLHQFLLKRLLRQACPQVISRSGEKGERVRCYIIYLKSHDGEWLLLVDSIDDMAFHGRRWNGTKFDEPDSVPFSEVEPSSIEIERFLGLFTFTYLGVIRCVLDDWTYLNRLPRIRESLSQFFFDRKDLGLTDRIETLQALVQASIEDPDYRTTEVSLPALIHGYRWILHPDKERQQTYARLLLSSFEESGEVRKDKDASYVVTGKALTTLSGYETEKQRHDQMLGQSRHMKWLTLALILVGLANAIVMYVVAND